MQNYTKIIGILEMKITDKHTHREVIVTPSDIIWCLRHYSQTLQRAEYSIGKIENNGARGS